MVGGEGQPPTSLICLIIAVVFATVIFDVFDVLDFFDVVKVTGRDGMRPGAETQ